VNVRITIDATLADKPECDPEALAERLFDFLGDDPGDLFPEIETVWGFSAERQP
jgi:hypothetical protein